MGIAHPSTGVRGFAGGGGWPHAGEGLVFSGPTCVRAKFMAVLCLAVFLLFLVPVLIYGSVALVVRAAGLDRKTKAGDVARAGEGLPAGRGAET